MGVALDFYGYRYDDSLPAFINVNDRFVYHRPTGRMLEAAGVAQQMTAASYTPGANEQGDANDWLAAQFGFDPNAVGSTAGGGSGSGSVSGGPAQSTGAAITASADLSAKTITFGGGPADKAYTVTITYQVDGSGADVSKAVNIAQGDTADATGLAAKTEIDGSDGLTATSAAGVVTVALGTATALDKLEATVT